LTKHFTVRKGGLMAAFFICYLVYPICKAHVQHFFYCRIASMKTIAAGILGNCQELSIK